MRAAFWKFAHKRYQSRRPHVLVEFAAFSWFTFFTVVYGAALAAGWIPDLTEALVGIALVALPFTAGVLHRRIRVEANKSPDALYRKRLLAHP
jgi:hypothetical protein